MTVSNVRRQIAIIGGGGVMGKHWVSAALQEAAEVVSVDPSHAPLEIIEIPKSDGAQVTYVRDVKELQLDQFDVIVVATLSDVRLAILKSLLRFNGPVILEKPLASSFEDLAGFSSVVRGNHYVNVTRRAMPHYNHLADTFNGSIECVSLKLTNANALSNFVHFASLVQSFSKREIDSLEVENLVIHSSKRPGFAECSGRFFLCSSGQVVGEIEAQIIPNMGRRQLVQFRSGNTEVVVDEIQGSLSVDGRATPFPLTYLSELGPRILQSVPSSGLPQASEILKLETMLFATLRKHFPSTIKIS